MAMAPQSEKYTEVRNRAWHGSLSHVRSVKMAFRSAMNFSLLIHAVAFGSAWHFVGSRPLRSHDAAPRDVWVGTSVSVVEEQAGHSVPSSPERAAGTEGVAPRPNAAARSVVRLPIPAKPAVRDATSSSSSSSAKEHAKPIRLAGSTAPVDLKQAMLDASNQKESGAGAFGAVGVDLRERRLPAAITRALPVAIGAQPGWWHSRLGSLGRLRFEIVLDEGGKIQDVDIEDEARNARLSSIVRRVSRLLSVGRYALPVSSLRGGRQRFELNLELAQESPPSSVTAEAGDAVDMGWEAPNLSMPGKAHIQEAQGRTMRAVLRVLPPLRVSSGEPEPVSE
jgi:hypothetical protein